MKRRAIEETEVAGSSSASSSILTIPEALMMEIFLKLSTATLIRCRRVCNSWRQIISSLSFIESRLAKGPPSVGICRSGEQLYLFEGEAPDHLAVYIPAENVGPYRYVLRIVNSCNGLLCMTRCSERIGQSGCKLFDHDSHVVSMYVANPVTGEYIGLPRWPKGMRVEICGLGFCGKSNRFKVFRILSDWKHYPEFVRCCPLQAADADLRSTVLEVYTLGSTGGTWRRLEVDFLSLRNCYLRSSSGSGRGFSYSSFSYVDGSLYWVATSKANGDAEVCSFDFESERLQQVMNNNSSHSPRLFGPLVEERSSGLVVKRLSDCPNTSRAHDDAVVHVPCFLSLKEIIEGLNREVVTKYFIERHHQLSQYPQDH